MRNLYKLFQFLLSLHTQHNITIFSNEVLSAASQLTETARHRRRTRLRKQFAQNSESETLRPQSARARPLPELEDSTAIVTSLLREKLQSEDGGALKPVQSQEKIDNPQASVTAEEKDYSAATEDQNERPLPGKNQYSSNHFY